MHFHAGQVGQDFGQILQPIQLNWTSGAWKNARNPDRSVRDVRSMRICADLSRP